MSDLTNFVSKTLQEHEQEVKKIRELETLLNTLQVKQKTSYIRYDVISNT